MAVIPKDKDDYQGTSGLVLKDSTLYVKLVLNCSTEVKHPDDYL
jgi:hypothetical protein